MSIRKTGVITNFTVIEAVGRTLAELLGTEMENPVPVTISSPGEEYGAPVGDSGEELGTSRVNLFLYRVEEPPHSRNNDWVDSGEGRQTPYPLCLNLFYMLNIFTPDRTSNLDEHRILGDVMRVFHANQIVDPIYFEGTLNPNEPPLGLPWEEIKIIHHALQLQDLSAVWHAISKPYRLSVVYEVSVVMIEPPEYRSRRVRRVDVTNVTVSPFKGRPVIESISPERGYSGDILAIKGEGFGSRFIKAYLNDTLMTPEAATLTEIKIRVPEELPPGLYSVIVANEEDRSEPVLFEEASPFLYRISPEAKYTEDHDFPKNGAGEPELTLWGGNLIPETPSTVKIISRHENDPEAPFVITSGLAMNSIKWVLPAGMREGRTRIKVLHGAARATNQLTLEMPSPRIYRVVPETVSNLPMDIVITGEHFRPDPGATELYLHTGSLSGIAALLPTEIITSTAKGGTEIRATLPLGLSKGIYQLAVRVYGKYYSGSFEIRIET